MEVIKLVPFRWPATWSDPKLVSLFEGGPVNCLVSNGAPAGVVEAARKAGLTVLEWSSLGATPLAKVNWNAAAERLTIADLVWPRAKPVVRGDRAVSGPTGGPWIDSNGWVARLAADRAPGKRIWLAFDPPKDEQPPNEAAYKAAVADAAAVGAWWILSLDEKLGQALAAGNAEAAKTWRGILGTVAFFETHSAWRGYVHQGPLAVISTFAGDDEFMSTELLNLAARGNLQYRIVDRSRVASENLTGLRAALWVDSDPPAADVVAKLAGFARAGGLLIVPPAAAHLFQGEGALACPVTGYELRTFGKGTVAAATRDWDDPYSLAADAHDLVSRRYDPIRMFNGSSYRTHYSVAPGGNDKLIQLISFAGASRFPGVGRSSEVTVRFPDRHSSVTFHRLDAAPETLRPVKDGNNIEYQLPQFAAYAALEVKA